MPSSFECYCALWMLLCSIAFGLIIDGQDKEQLVIRFGLFCIALGQLFEPFGSVSGMWIRLGCWGFVVMAATTYMIAAGTPLTAPAQLLLHAYIATMLLMTHARAQMVREEVVEAKMAPEIVKVAVEVGSNAEH